MRKFFIAVAVASSVLISGCAAVVQGGAALAAGNAKEHPASQNFAVLCSKCTTLKINELNSIHSDIKIRMLHSPFFPALFQFEQQPGARRQQRWAAEKTLPSSKTASIS